MPLTDKSSSDFPSRQVLAVLIMELTDYVRLVEEDQHGTGQRWRRLVAAVRNDILPTHGGELVETRGDSLVLTFAQAQPAVHAAFAIKRFCNGLNDGIPQQNHFHLRGGIHMGEVFIEDHEVSGHTVNLARRLMTSEAGPGEIVVTADVHDQLTPTLDANIEDLGTCHLKDIKEPVRAYRVGPRGPRPAIEPETATMPSLLAGIAATPLTTKSTDPARDVLTIGSEVSLHSLQDSPEVSSSAHRWVAIAMMDVVGFTSLTERDEDATLLRWGILLKSCIEPAIERYHGKVFRKLGDGMLIAFPAAYQALACVLEIQRYFTAQAHEQPSFKLRAAIHAGEVVVLSGDLQGNAVNITARLQEFAAPGGIVVSSTIEELVRGQIGETMEDIGDIGLKGIERRVRVYSLLERPAWLQESRAPSIAVLPFAESDAPEGDYFGDGIVEDIVSALATLPDLFVVSRGSTLSFRSGATDLRKVRQVLGVRYALSGSIRRGHDRIRIAAELSDCESLNVLWSDRIDGRFDDIFDFQDRMSQQIVATLAPHLQEAEIARIARKRPENLSAYDCFLRGLDLVYRLDRERFDNAQVMFARAIQLDPQYAAPYAYSALWHAVRIGQGWSPDVMADQAAVTDLAAAALERDRLDASSLALCGHFRSILFRDFRGAFALFDRAIAAGPNCAVAWTRSSPTYSYVGDWKEGLRRAEHGLRLSPLDRHVFYTYTALCLAAYTGEHYDEAIEWGYKAMSENPNFTANLRLLCASLVAAGRIDEARQVADQMLRAGPDFRVERFTASYAYKEPEQREKLAAHLRAAGLPR